MVYFLLYLLSGCRGSRLEPGPQVSINSFGQVCGSNREKIDEISGD